MSDHVWRDVPAPTMVSPGRFRANWNSVALFYNLTTATRPDDYAETSAADAREWLDEGTTPADPTISAFMTQYWGTLSLGRFAFALNTPRDSSGTPLIPTIAAPGGDVHDYVGLMQACIQANAEAIWQAAGSLMLDGRRYIPSIVLVHRYFSGAWAWGGWRQTVGSTEYEIARITHMPYSLGFVNATTAEYPDVPANRIRGFWGTLCHEYSHNFLDFGDLYGPQGCTGYWDLLGDNSPPGVMSEVCSAHKELIGWLTFKEVIRGPIVPAGRRSLRPYTTSGEAIKVIPDPDHNPHEYFVLEYRRRTGDELWVPDRGMTERGLLITHMNDRLGIPWTWLNREAPYYDPEYADFSDRGGALWTGWDRLEGAVYPNGSNNSFTPGSSPSSALYGRNSGLHITNIAVSDAEVTFDLRIDLRTEVGWNVGDRDLCVAGRFTPDAIDRGQEIFARGDNAVALLRMREAQWFVRARQNDWIDGWNLGPEDRIVPGDFDGDRLDEIYIRSPEWAGILKWSGNGFSTLTVQQDWIDGWNLGKDDRELAADLDGDGRAEIFIRSPDYAGVMDLEGGRLRALSVQHDWIDEWNLGVDNEEFVGRFTQRDRQEILIRSPEWLGVFVWDAAANLLRLRSIQHDWVDGWNLGPLDKHTIGDLDGDGIDEIYIRSPEWAGVLKWNGERFAVVWMTQGSIPHWIEGGWPASIPLTGDDRSYAGRLLPNRDGIIHRGANHLAVLMLHESAMKLRMYLESPIAGRLSLSAEDKFVLGDFHGLGRDRSVPDVDFVMDGLADVFIHNTSGTGMVGVNYWPDPAMRDGFGEQAGLTWIAQGSLLVSDH